MPAPPRTPDRPAGRAAGRVGARAPVSLDRALERLPLFRLSDSADDGALTYAPRPGARWRVLPTPGDRLPGTFDQDVYVGLLHHWAESGRPGDGAISFTLHAFLRQLGRTPDGRTYEQLRGALTRLERTTLESAGAYVDASLPPPAADAGPLRFTLLASVVIERRRVVEEAQDQLALFPELVATEPGDARVVLGPAVRAAIAAGRTSTISWARYQRLRSPVARRLYRLLTALWADDGDGPAGLLAPELALLAEDRAGGRRWRAPLDRWAEVLPLTQRYPSHLQRVLAPAHEMLVKAGVVRSAACVQDGRSWWVEYEAPAD